MWLHAHIGFWTLAFILFVLSYLLQKSGKKRIGKVLHMILRLDFILVIITGIKLVSVWYIAGVYGYSSLKGLFGLLLVMMMELILTRGNQKKGTGVYWVLLLVSVVAVFYIGYVKLG